MTPHITIAHKQRGGHISQSEAAAMAGLIEEIMPDEFQLFDPVIHFRPRPDFDATQKIHVRPPRGMSPQ